MNSANIQTSLAGRYASALFELAHENDAKRGVERVETDLNTLAAALAESADLRAVTTNPQLSRKVQSDTIAAVAKQLKLGELTAKFLGVLAANRRLGDLADMIRAFASIAAAQRGEITAEVVSAHALSKKNIDALSKKLAEREGQNVTIKAKVDPDLLGGLVITIGSRRIDGSIRTRLNSLAHAMKG